MHHSDKCGKTFNPVRSTLIILCYLGLIFATSPIVPHFVFFLQQYGPLGRIVNVSISAFLTLAVLVAIIRSRYFHGLTALVFIPLAIITVWAMNYITLPIERVHIIEYGILSILLFRVCFHFTNPIYAAIQSLFLATLAGCVDEGIQYFLPNRFFALGDIYLNVIGALAGLLYYGIYFWIRCSED